MASNELERDLTKASVGYLSKDEYKRKREDIEEEKALNALKQRINGPEVVATMPEQDADGSSAPPSESKKKKDKKKDKKKLAALSFGDELDEEAESSPGAVARGGMAFARARDKEQQAERQEVAMREVLLQQRKAKQEPLTLKYCFRSEMTQRELPGGSHKGTVVVKRGDTADEVAIAVRTDVEKRGGKFAPNAVQGIREERDVILVCCCDGMPNGSFVIPGAVSLVELWTRRWCDQPTTLFDEFRHGVMVTERRWFEQQRHTFPYCYWRMYETLEEYSLKEFIAKRDQPANNFEPRRESKQKR